MTILITGATGKVGRELVEVLRERGIAHKAASRSPESGPDTVRFDWNDESTWDDALEGVTRVWVVPQAAGAYDVSAVVGRFLDHAVDTRPIEKVGVLSVRNAEQLNSDLPSLKVERHLAQRSVPWFSLRPTWFFQNLTGGMFRRSIEHDGMLRAPTGDGQVSFIDALDIAEAAVAGFEGEAQGPYELTGPEALSFGQLAERMSQVWGRPVAHEDVSFEEMEVYLAGLGLVPAHVTALTNHFRRIHTGVSGEVTDGFASLTGRDPRRFHEFLDRCRPAWAASA